MLSVKNLTKLFKDKKSKTNVGIQNVSFDAGRGKILGLIGANGAGKTTSMRIIAGFMKPDSGKITLDGKNINNIKDIRKRISFVSGETQIFDRLTAYEILELFGKFGGLSKKEIDEKIKEVSQKLQMDDFLNRQTENFSTGMKQKVSFARALMTNPDVLVFDEVTNGLDIFAAREVKNIILELKKENKIILYSTHIMPDAEELCDDLVVIQEGQVLEKGEKEEVKKKYNSESIENIFFDLVKSIKK